MRRLRLFTTLLALLWVWSGTAAATAQSGGGRATGGSATRIVRYHGYRLTVPAAWPVYDLAADPSVCVRFNRHAVYLGQPSAQQRCPARAIGRTEAILVQPLSARGASASATGGSALPQATNAGAQPRAGNSAVLTAPKAGVVVTATWQRDPSQVARVLGVRSLAPHGTGAGAAAVRAPALRPAPAHRARDPVFTGLGFDACSTPSAAAMSAWAASPYRAVGIYIGGANQACSQPNQSASWVSQETAAGWALIPTYVGLQAPSNECGCASIVPSQAAPEGAAAAVDAIAHAQALGIEPGNPIYYDMEGYSHTAANTSAVLAFLSAWTSTLHTDGYLSGVYSAANSGVTDLVAQYGTAYPEPDEIWIAEWNGEQTTSSLYLPTADWANHQRVHQYQGGHNATYGGVTINIDSDDVDAGGAAGNVQFPNGTYVQVAGTTTFWEIAGNAPLLVSNWSDVGGVQPYTVITQQQFNALGPVPSNGTLFETDTGAIYVIAGGAPLYVSSLAVFTGAPTPFLVDAWDIENVGNPASHLDAVPANGTFVGTTTGRNYRVAGDAPIGISKWSLFGGPQPSVLIDPWDIFNESNPLARLVARPAVGTVVEGLPSGAYWQFGPTHRYLVAANPAAVRVDDIGLTRYAAIPCRVPNLARMTLTQVKTALLKADCHLGRVRERPVTARRHTLRVIKQSPRPRTRKGADYTVGITLG